MKVSPLLTEALKYAELYGFSIIPVGKDKRPLLRSWKEWQTKKADAEQIYKWWREYADANVGIVTGEISGITVVDVDTHKGGSDAVFPKSYTVITGNGGVQLYYKYKKGLTVSANSYAHLPHVDIRNDGGFVVAPPSITDYEEKGVKKGGAYKVLHNQDFAPFPEDLFIGPKNPISKQKVSALLRGLNKMAEGDGRNNTLTSVIGKLLNVVDLADHETVAWPIALSINQQFKTPLKEGEVRTIFNSIHKKEAGKPLATVEFLKNDKGIIANEENVYRTVKNDPELCGKFRYNIFTGILESCYDNEKWEALQRVDVIGTRMYLMRTYPHFTKIAHSAVEDAIIRYGKEKKVSPPAEYFKSLVWDKKARLDSWISSTYNTPNDEYHKAVGANWLKGMVKRIIQPGCKFDYVLVLEGKQGIRKSTSLAILGGDWHVETVFAPDNKDFFMLLGGKAIVEFSEGETLSRTEAKHLKAVITMQFDKYRPPYERSPKEFPRQCVFAMTTNQDQYLKDETGNRRWLPVACEGIVNVEWLEENREQLFAEAYHRLTVKKESVHEFPAEETLRQQSLRQTVDPRAEQIFEWYFSKLTPSDRDKGITTRMAFVAGIHGNAPFGREMGRLEEMVVGGILRDTLKLEKRRTMTGTDRFYRYYPSKETEEMSPQGSLLDPKTPLEKEVDEVYNSNRW